MIHLNKQDIALVLRMRRHGIVNPIYTLRAARKAGLPIALACAFLEQESGGGRNVFGHDPTIFAGAGRVTKAKYLAYKRARKLSGNRKMQGVGPMQLTYWAFQDQCDAQGGCWNPYSNLLVGFTLAARNIRRYGKRLGVRAYNGSGPAADRYADQVLARENKWTKLLAGKTPPKPRRMPRRILALRYAEMEAKRRVRERGGNNRGPDVRKYLAEVGLGEGYAWCDAFVSWCLHKAFGKRLPIESAGVIVTYQKARELGWLVSRPFAGDLVLFDFDGDGAKDDHIGFVEKVLRLGPVWLLRTIEGNTESGDAGSQADGGGVYRRIRSVPARSAAFVRVPG